MELFKLFGTIALNNSEANKGIDETSEKAKDAGKEVKDFGDEGEKSEGKLGKAFSKMGSAAVKVGKTIAVGLAAGGAAVVAIGKQAIEAYADYEQLVGGVETLFDKNADTVIKNASKAYKTAGLSANEYMETVTSFSASLLQSLGGDTEKAAKKADLAIVDMSDNANKMGTSMESIQTAYQGFAKQNYTMLDNLKLGYGGTKEEMERLLEDATKLSGVEYDISSYADIVDAIHVVQTEMGITGTTAKEASTTISGSISSAKAAWQNLLVGLADDTQDLDELVNNFFDSIVTVGDNIIPRISIVLDGIAKMVEKLAPKLVAEIPKILTTLLPAVVKGAKSILTAVVDIIPELADMILEILPDIISAVEDIFKAIVDALPKLIKSIASALPTLIPQLVTAIINITVFHNGVQIFSGRVTEEGTDFYKNKKYVCKGELDYLTDSIQRPAEYHNMTVRGFLETLIGIHNAQVIESNVKITFNEQCSTQNENHLSLYYKKSGVWYRVLDRVKGVDVAGKTFVVPTLDFYIFFTGGSSTTYGFKVDSVELTDDECDTATRIAPFGYMLNYPMTTTSDLDDVQTPHPYNSNQNRGWHFTKVVPSDYVGKKTFRVGQVTVVDSNDSLYRYTNYENTLTCIKEKLVKSLGGHIQVRTVDGIKYIDYLADYPVINEQTIEFGKNLLDFSQTIDAQDIATAIIPLGAKLETSTIPALDERLTIKSVNNGCDFVFSQEAVDTYGWVFRTVEFDAVNVPSNLLRKGTEYLQSVQWENLVLSVTAVDLNNLDVNIERIHLLDKVRVISSPHGLDRYFPVTELKLNLMKPENDKITLGSEASGSTFTSSNISSNSDIVKRIEAIPPERVVLQEAIDNATALITAATHGHVVTTAEEQLIMDTDDIETATKVWRWNLNGFGYSGTGYNGSYVPAITMDGGIVGERIVAGSISADKLSVAYRSTVEKQITDAQSNAEENAEGYTDEKLKSYWTAVEVQTKIENTADSVLISAEEKAIAYTDDQLKNYSTSASIKVTTDAITAEVNKKFNSSEWSTKLQQSATDVRIAWNNISKYIQFAAGELRIYDSAVESTQKLRSKFNDSGNHFYRDDYYVGAIGTNEWAKDETHKGLVFDLNNQGKYMAFAQKAKASDTTYTTMLCFSRANSIYDEYGLHLGCNLYGHNYTIKDVYLSGVNVKYSGENYSGYTGTIPIVTDVTITAKSDGGISWNIKESKLRVSNGIIVGYWT